MKQDEILHVHFLHKHVPSKIASISLFLMITATCAVTFIYAKETLEVKELILSKAGNNAIEFTYGSWPALENAQFYEKVKQDLIAQTANFIEADLYSMTLRVFKNGQNIKEVKILSKGREGSWWETPAGLYQISSAHESAYSSFGQVYMPWSMQFQGNFFIHGWPYYPNGTAVSPGYSGGCIRLSTEDAKEVFYLAQIGMPILVSKTIEEQDDQFVYKRTTPLPQTISYLAADLENNFVLAENQSLAPRSIASITKFISALVAVEYINVEKEITIDKSMLAKTSIPRLQEGEKASILDLLSILLMESSNEAALAIASALGEKNFIGLMNKKAHAIGMKNSSFEDTAGVNSENISTAQDLYMLAKYLYYNRSFVLNMSVGKENRTVYGTSKFKNVLNLNSIPGLKTMIGGKTGLSSTAKDSLLGVFEIKIGDKTRPIVIVVLGSDDSKRDVKLLVEHVIANFES